MAKIAHDSLPVGPLNVVMPAEEPHRTDKAPGILVDLDDTIRQWNPGPNMYAGLNSHSIMPNRKETLAPLKKLGFRIIGVTNHSCKSDAGHRGLTPDKLHKIQHETLGLMDGLIDDIVYSPKPDPDVLKPAPTMLHYAIERHGLDPERIIMVGDNEDHDGGAAKAAGVPYMHSDHFFADPEVTVKAITKELEGSGHEKKADVISTVPMPEYIHLNSQGQVLAAPDKNRRYRFPRQGTGKPAPYEPTLRFLPPEGAAEPGVHGYDVNFNIGEGDIDPTTAGMEGATWMDPQAVLKDMYASMGLKANAGYRDLDRARARVLLRALKRRKPPQVPNALPPA
jgi:HAD superfamily hydrolase (TIGR01662 family)